MKKLTYILILAFIAVGCHKAGSDLEPAAGTLETQPEDAAVTHIKDVSVTVQADAWPADPGITQEVTPLQVTIHNNSNMPVVISYDNFALVTPNGEYHAAIPPFKTQSSHNELELFEDYKPIDPDFIYQNYAVAPLYGSLYEIDGYDAYDFYNHTYNKDYYGYWEKHNDRKTPLPTEKMLTHAIPEGVIKPGGMIKGFLYFQKIEAEETGWIQFTAELQNVKTGKIFGQISIPFNVANKQT